jgi:hypothetical protein
VDSTSDPGPAAFPLARLGLVTVGSRKEKKLCESECLCYERNTRGGSASSCPAPLGEIDERDLHDDRVYPLFQATVVVPSWMRTQ